ncbi:MULTISPECIES: membrane protein insertion efficiency factor YidD [Helicobacter]|uniref:Protein YidD n=1 Tax=Helicobacter typhlonius TaxID=76936 RepID=A0A0S4PWA4_9HELI|nr:MULTISPECIES: membrane protein insertion efficiency factor YidD [Helicobacter]CUU40186.1 Protein YidD [Helicobacter typhlonius]
MCLLYRVSHIVHYAVCSVLHILRQIFILSVRFYQKSLSSLSVGACRYYPSCSEYTLWLLYFDNPFIALYKSLLRILSCNQFFVGGIAYPKARLKFKNIVFVRKKVKYWFVPTANTSFLDIMRVSSQTYIMRVYIIKSIF